MPFYTETAVEPFMALNSFGSQFNPESIPPYHEWVANTTFDPFGPEPAAPTSYPNPGTPALFPTRAGFRSGENVDWGSRADLDHGPPKDMALFSQEVSSDHPRGSRTRH